MRLLGPTDFPRVLPLVPPAAEAGHMAFVHAVLAGSQPGFVVVDDLAAPRSALVCNLSDFWFALGTPDATLVDAAMPLLSERCPARSGTALWTTSAAWEGALRPLFYSAARRREFHFAPGHGETYLALAPAGFELLPMDASIAGLLGEDGRQGVDPWVVQIWGGAEAFSARTFGYALLRDGKIASFCAACAIGGPPDDCEAEIEIGTAPRFQGAGLATVAGRAFIHESLARGYRPAWTCAEHNTASVRLAARLGFREFRTVAGFPLARGMRREGGRWRLAAPASENEPG